MPIPAPLRRNASKKKKQKRIGEVLHELKRGKHHGERTRAQEIAIAMKSSGEDGDGKRLTNRNAQRSKSKAGRRNRPHAQKRKSRRSARQR